jgi:anaerobic carbon-monoxide dehydrogenase iron sulfur subunit
MMSKSLVIDLDKCTGCRTCELACSFIHHGEYNPVKSAIQVSIFAEDAFFVPVVCLQCKKPHCAKVCPTGALSIYDQDGAFVVQVNRETCVGCKMCTLACPFGCIFISEEGVAKKCDQCGGQPECVVFCPTGAIEFKDEQDGVLAKSRKTAEKIYHQKEASQ